MVDWALATASLIRTVEAFVAEGIHPDELAEHVDDLDRGLVGLGEAVAEFIDETANPIWNP